MFQWGVGSIMIPLVIGLAVWRVAEVVAKRRISLMALVSVGGGLAGFYLGDALVNGPYVPAGRIVAASLIGAAAAASLACYLVIRARS